MRCEGQKLDAAKRVFNKQHVEEKVVSRRRGRRRPGGARAMSFRESGARKAVVRERHGEKPCAVETIIRDARGVLT